MEDKFTELTSQKSKDELIHILINKDEYKLELVSAAENELKKRAEKEFTSIPTSPSPTSNELDTPFGIYLASILLFAFGPIWIVIGLFQAGGSA